MILEHHGRISWAEDAEPPFSGKVHIILEDTEREEGSCWLVCGANNWATEDWCCDWTEDPITCKSCLRLKQETIEAAKLDMQNQKCYFD